MTSGCSAELGSDSDFLRLFNQPGAIKLRRH
eukprot:CAMPEP_0197697920 /NCGR_PEP_ID=MMETSP1338-20131121/118639_1 /TAXON_ID=43686 ORGANISM="Pelagodinium beii, Strain RCC1491" /NCGR_SAMPLE_ID=MMETSP1338 /ASSEMBLY_ACC=CAM_ASM_000754 /LENGTH=30 /DNA_ID= /DNA_START= /DNA_END= /DNA_ORIENTATION=